MRTRDLVELSGRLSPSRVWAYSPDLGVNRHWMMDVLDALLGYKTPEEAEAALQVWQVKETARRIDRRPKVGAWLDEFEEKMAQLNQIAKLHDSLLGALREFERMRDEEDVKGFLAMWPPSQVEAFLARFPPEDVEEARREGLLPEARAKNA